jgi:predicted dehydrogenase
VKQVEQNYRSGKLRVIDAPAPMASPGAALVRSRVSLISAGTEKQIVDLARASLAGKAMARPDLVRQTLRKVKAEGVGAVARKVFAKLDTPFPLGYSLAGEVSEAGAGAGVAAGDRVACAGAGIANHAEYNAVPKNLMVRIPEGVDDEAASFVTVGAIALQSVRVAAPTLGERVVVTGLGLIGLLTVQLLKANGCRVLGFDPSPARVALARELGADAAVSESLAAAVAGFTAGHGADAVIVTASTKSNAPLNEAAEISRLKGRVVLVGMVGMTLDREPFYKRELDLRLSLSYGPGRHDPAYEIEGHDYPLAYVRWTEQRNMEAFLELVAAGRVTPDRLVTHRFPIAEAEKAYQLMDGDEPYLGILLTYPDEAGQPARAVEVRPSSARAEGDGIAFIGFGNYAKSMLLPAVRKAGGVNLRTIVTATGLSAHAGAEKYGFARAATDPEEALADPAVSTVFIATRHDSHAALAIRALQAGKHVFVEKPLALDGDELAAVIAAAEAGPGLLTVGFNRRFAPMVLEAQKALGARTGPLAMTYRVNAGAIPRDNWVHGAQGGGRIAGEACHFVDTLAALCGSVPVEVEAASPAGIADSVAAVLRFADGSVGTILYSSLGDPAVAKERIEIFGTGIVVEINDYSEIAISRGGRTKRRKAAQDKGQANLVAAFLSAAAAGGPPPIPLAALERVSAATLALANAGS